MVTPTILRRNPFLSVLSEIIHIYWTTPLSGGRNYFQAMFVDGSIDYGKYIKDPAKYIKTERDLAAKKAGSLKEKLEVLKKIHGIYQDKLTPQAFVNFARQLFQDIFHDQIAQLLHAFPRDYKDDKGNLFWSSPKRPPYVIDFHSHDEMHFLFIRSICQIMASCFDVKFQESDAHIHEMLKHAKFEVHKPVEKKIKKDDNDTTADNHDQDEIILDQLVILSLQVSRTCQHEA